MKRQIFVSFAVALLTVSCSTDKTVDPPLSDASPGNNNLHKCSSCIYLKVTPYYRNADSTWCVGMRVFRADGASLPPTGNYVWYRETTPCDSSVNWNVWLDSVKCATTSGYSDRNLPMSRFLFKVTYDGSETPPILIGRDMRPYPLTGCLADGCADPDSIFVLETQTCADSL